VTSQRGIVEVLFGAVWGTVCRDSWDLNDSHVICRHLGYDEAQSDFDPEAFGDFVVETELTWISNVRCKGNENFLSECSFDEWGRTLCRSFTPASVICKPPAPLGRPEFVVSDLTSIVVTWMSSKTSKYFVQIWNNRTLVWEATRCTESTIAGACVTESPRATIVDLKPSTTYYFRIYVSKVSVSSPSEPMKTTKLGPPGKPFFVSNAIDSITIGWSSQSLQNMTYTVEIKEESSWMDASCGPDSLLPNRCTVRGSAVRVTGLRPNTAYRFRVNAVYKEIKSDFSQPSDPFPTAGDAGTGDCLPCAVQTKFSLSTPFVQNVYDFTMFYTFHEPRNLY